MQSMLSKSVPGSMQLLMQRQLVAIWKESLVSYPSFCLAVPKVESKRYSEGGRCIGRDWNLTLHSLAQNLTAQPTLLVPVPWSWDQILVAVLLHLRPSLRQSSHFNFQCHRSSFGLRVERPYFDSRKCNLFSFAHRPGQIRDHSTLSSTDNGGCLPGYKAAGA